MNKTKLTNKRKTQNNVQDMGGQKLKQTKNYATIKQLTKPKLQKPKQKCYKQMFQTEYIYIYSALGELWVVEVPHIIRDEGWNSQHVLFIFFVFGCTLTM